MKIIAVDFDGTIAKTRYPIIVELMPEASHIPQWRRMGNKVVLWTCRTGEPLNAAVAFCKEHGIVFDGVNENVQTKYGDDPRKISADYYIDDKCPMPIEEQWQRVNSLLGGSTRKTINQNVLSRQLRKG